MGIPVGDKEHRYFLSLTIMEDELDDIQIDVYEVMRHIIEIIDDFVNEEDDVDEDETQVVEEIIGGVGVPTQISIPGFENGSGLDKVTIY